MSNGVTGGYEKGGHRQRIRYDRDENEPPSVAAAKAIAQFRDEAVTGASVRLYDYVDPDALDALFADRHDGRPRSNGRVRFAVEGATVVVRPTGVVVFE